MLVDWVEKDDETWWLDWGGPNTKNSPFRYDLTDLGRRAPGKRHYPYQFIEGWRKVLEIGIAGYRILPQLIEIGKRQPVWFLPGHGPLSVFEFWYNFVYGPQRAKPTRKGLQKRAKKASKAIEAQDDSDEIMHAGSQKEFEGWTLLQTAEEHKEVGRRFNNCVWWNHWINRKEERPRRTYVQLKYATPRQRVPYARLAAFEQREGEWVPEPVEHAYSDEYGWGEEGGRDSDEPALRLGQKLAEAGWPNPKKSEFVYKWEPGPPAVGGHSLRIFKERDKETHALVFVGTPAQTARLVRLIPRYRKHTASPRVIERAEGRVAYLDFIGVGDKGRGVGSRLISTLMGLLQEAGVGTLFGHMVQDADSEARWRFFAAHGAEMIAPPGDPPTRGVLFQIRLPGY